MRGQFFSPAFLKTETAEEYFYQAGKQGHSHIRLLLWSNLEIMSGTSEGVIRISLGRASLLGGKSGKSIPEEIVRTVTKF